MFLVKLLSVCIVVDWVSCEAFWNKVAVFVPLYKASNSWNCPSVTPLDVVADDAVEPLYVENVSPVVDGKLINTLSLVAPLPKSNILAPAVTETGLATAITVIPLVKFAMPAGNCKN